MILLGQFGSLKGMNNDYICNSKYDGEIFEKVLMLKELDHWPSINTFMEKEYEMKWILYRREK